MRSVFPRLPRPVRIRALRHILIIGPTIGLAFLLAAFPSARAVGQDRPEPSLAVYLNADFTHSRVVGASLLLGLESGLAVGEARFGGPPISVLARDHRNNIRRTGSMVEEAADNPETLAIVGGMHTPHYLKHGPTINNEGLVLLLPWSAGARLTRLAEGTRNHIFRLSVDDRKAAPFLAVQAEGHGCKTVATLAVDNGWGRQNALALGSYLPSHDVRLVDQGFIRHDGGADTVAAAVEKIAQHRPDCVIFVLGGRISALAASAMAGWSSPPDILSHWGILGSDFPDLASPEVWTRIDIALLSTCVLDIEGIRPTHAAEAAAAAAALQPDVRSLDDIGSLPAFAHAYDLGLLLRAATRQASGDPRWSDGRVARSAALRDTLEALGTPVEGLLKRYDAPFARFSSETPDGHEALGSEDLCLARLRRDGGLDASSWGVSP